MSEKTSRRVLAEMRDTPPEAPRDTSACEAYGCPCVASVNVGVGLQCSWHWGVPSERWQATTRALREHQWLIDHITDMQQRHSRGDSQCVALALALEFWAQHPEKQPNAHEKRHFNGYIGRMRNELRHRIGALEHPPKPTVPQSEWAEFSGMFRPGSVEDGNSQKAKQ